MMKIKRHFFINGLAHESDDGSWVNYTDVVGALGDLHKTIHCLEKEKHDLEDNLKCVERGNIELQARIKELESEISKLGATCEEYSWKINKLEHVNHINEIKAQGIEEAINEANHEMHEIFDNEFHVSLHVANLRIFIDRLRTKHD